MANVRSFRVVLRVACLFPLALFVGTYGSLLLTVGNAIAVPIRPGDLLVDGSVLVDPSTGSQTLVSAGDVSAALANGLSLIRGSGPSEIAPNGDIVSITPTQIVRLNPVSGVQSIILASFSALGSQPNNLEVAPNGDVWITTQVCCLFRIASGTNLLSGPLFGLDVHPLGLEVGPKGDVFVVGASTDGIFHFDPATSSATFIRGHPLYEFADIIQGPDGTLYGASFPGLDSAKVSRVDPITGVETIISSNGLLGANHIALFVPEPPSIVLIALGFGLMLAAVGYQRLRPRQTC